MLARRSRTRQTPSKIDFKITDPLILSGGQQLAQGHPRLCRGSKWPLPRPRTRIFAPVLSKMSLPGAPNLTHGRHQLKPLEYIVQSYRTVHPKSCCQSLPNNQQSLYTRNVQKARKRKVLSNLQAFEVFALLEKPQPAQQTINIDS